ncbi:hypothetical protein PACTADRAFT_56991 [Pachysolen tannophilus NRRL Y-2460]|uniref:Uncharacterized protein n=1 Tax=Pachysolen tannophilus NRRL Y-2460 TaxID=669874 RepID=A0A1E4TWS3_PACTA|nr:hypothetical protein PACTADRAFT_56991 [Pachysolen tannophilus NRRL Y-2460]
MISVAYMDPGNYSTDISGGASNKFSLLFVILLSNIIAIFLQTLCIKLGSVTGLDLSRACRLYLPNWLNYTIYAFAECAIVATDIAEVIGTAIALNVLIKVPLPAGVILTITDVLFVLMAYRPGSSLKFVKMFEYAVAVLVLAVVVCFCIELSYIPQQSVGKIFRGYLPSSEILQNGGIYTAASILGATVMPHSLFLGSGLVQPRLREYDLQNGYIQLSENAEENEESYFDYKPSLKAIKYALKFSIIELALNLFTFALFVNSAILIVAGSTLYGTEQAIDADLYTIHTLLAQTISPAVSTVFMLALLCSGQSAGIVCTIAGQIVSEGHINWNLKPWQRRLATRSIAIVPCLIITLCIGKSGLSNALNASQVVLSILLPFLIAPLIYFTSSKKIMRVDISNNDFHRPNNDNDNDNKNKNSDNIFHEIELNDLENETNNSNKYKIVANNWVTTVIATAVWIFISMLNIYAIVQVARDGI